jgi:hypothetical protein
LNFELPLGASQFSSVIVQHEGDVGAGSPPLRFRAAPAEMTPLVSRLAQLAHDYSEAFDTRSRELA